MSTPPPLSSPRWNSTTKLVVGLSAVALFAALLIYFRSIVGPLILSFILAFFLQPVAARLSKVFNASWRVSVNLLYLALLILLIALFTATGIGIVQQTQSLFDFINRFLTDLPALIEELSSKIFVVGPFQLNLSQFDLTSLAEQILGVVQPLLGQAGSLISKVATSAASFLGWGLFVLLVSYYLLAESGQIRENLVFIKVPGYSEDTRRLARELANIWDAYLRSQLVVILLVVAAYYILLSILGLNLALAIALLAGLARFVPYIGAWATWITTTIVALLQSANYFHLAPSQYAILVIVACIFLDQVFDYIVVPRMMGQALRVHPAGVLVAAIIATNLIGLVGLVLAAPVLATLNLAGGYVGRKMFDLEPWSEAEKSPSLPELPVKRAVRRLRAWWRRRKRS